MKKIIISCAFLAMVAFLAVPLAVRGEEKSAKEDKPAVRLAVVPFEILSPKDELSKSVICPVCSRSFSAGKMTKGAENIVRELFLEKMKEYKEVEVIEPAKVTGVYNLIASQSFKRNMTKVLQKVGAEVQADFVAVGYVFRYQERVGYDYSAEKPASVGLEFHVIKVTDGSQVWHGVFEKTQKSLMEDAFQISSYVKGGGKWLTARQLAKQGIDEVLGKFPGFEK